MSIDPNTLVSIVSVGHFVVLFRDVLIEMNDFLNIDVTSLTSLLDRTVKVLCQKKNTVTFFLSVL